MKNMRVSRMTTLALLSAMAFLVSLLSLFPLIPVVPWLLYDAKDVIIVLGGLIYGPVASLIVSGISALLEVMVKGGTWIDFIMNVIASCSFACVVSVMYKHHKNKKGLYKGLILGVFSMTLAMVVWNYVMTPIYYHMPREAVVAVMIPGIIPFNILKASINGVMIIALYNVLSRTSFFKHVEDTQKSSQWYWSLGLFVCLSIVLVVCAMHGMI